MNPHYPGGPPAPQNMPGQHYSRRQHEYHQYQHATPHSPGGHNPYAYPYVPHYYGQPVPMPYQMPRWAPQQQYNQYGMPPPMHNPQRSPMVVSSQPHMPPGPRPMPYSNPPLPPQSPYSNPQVTSSAVSQAVSSPREIPSKTSTPQPTSRRSSVAQPVSTTRMPFYPQLPWYSPPEARNSFPPKASRARRRRNFQNVSEGVLLPSREPEAPDEQEQANIDFEEVPAATAATTAATSESTTAAPEQIGQATADQPVSSPAPSSTSVSKPSTVETHRRSETRSNIPIIPALPQIPASRPKQAAAPQTNGSHELNGTTTEVTQATPPPQADAAASENLASVVSPKAQPKSWADLVRTKGSLNANSALVNGNALSNGADSTRSGTIGEVLKQFDVEDHQKVPFLEPRGLVNTGNMCYMNSILQVLVFCIPFYDFLDQVGKRAVHSFKSDTPLIDAMIMFMREYKVIDSAESVEKLRMRLKDAELEQYGDPLIPEYVYSVINQLPRFSSMRRGHQQDAEEFLGFLLAGLHDECVTVMRLQGTADIPDLPASPASSAQQSEANGWLEVGPKQKSAITRQSGDPSASSPLSRIFGGALRSELRVPGLKTSVTLEPYQPLQLDIGSPNINNITDALKGLTKSESLTGDFNSPRGPGTTATKQVFIETLPPVLILHLKRFQYDSSGGTQKIWKRIGYPLDLEMPKEVFAPAKRGGMAVKGGLPKYRLTAVVYHHGKSAAGGHYTVDLLRQDKREWVRIDDTLIRRIRPEDVAEAGTEEDPKILAKALERHQQEAEVFKRNPYEGLDGEHENGDDGKAWSDVNGSDHKKRWAGVAAAGGGTATPSTAGKRTPRRDGVKDNKVAYILLYEKVSS
ncbi:cysteine proteinase [Myriangium duriaei CBS 260.36]|uniref:Ubiquitin carboxyl-terminal hydrolase n=1 Tax=Myriangium duriaei CBS 260.36 TaxID=1168546 RepID=A0A9P4IUS1_9PEZI|nr:cysteine proteinase [Myriangium duriaei CBS 260.36]